MPEISRFDGMVIKNYFGDHPPPHFHAEYAEDRAVVDGYVRATADMDVRVPRERSNPERLVLALKKFGFDVPELVPDILLVKAWKEPIGRRLYAVGTPRSGVSSKRQ